MQLYSLTLLSRKKKRENEGLFYPGTISRLVLAFKQITSFTSPPLLLQRYCTGRGGSGEAGEAGLLFTGQQ